VTFTPVKEVATSNAFATRVRLPAARQTSGERQFQGKRIPVEAALTGDPRLVFQSIVYDPLTASMLSLTETKAMVNGILQQNQGYLPQIKRFEV